MEINPVIPTYTLNLIKINNNIIEFGYHQSVVYVDFTTTIDSEYDLVTSYLIYKKKKIMSIHTKLCEKSSY